MFRCRSAAGITAEVLSTMITQASGIVTMSTDVAIVMFHDGSPLNEYDHNTGQSYHTYDEPR